MLLGLFRGLYCAFCRRAIASLGRLASALAPAGVQILGVVASPTLHTRLYFRYHPLPIALGADPAMTTHAAYGVPKVPKEEGWNLSVRINPTGELPEPLPIWEANKALGQRDRFTPTSTDHDDMHRTWSQLSAHFLIDARGIVRWRFIEAAEGPAGLGTFPAEAAVVTAVRTLLP